MNPFRTLLLPVLFAAIAAHGPEVRAQNPACGSLINTSVSLQGDLVCAPGVNALEVGADNLTIRLNGFTIRGAAGPVVDPTGIQSRGFSGLTIAGPGSITGFHAPVHLEGGVGHYVAAVSMTGNRGGLSLVDVSDSSVKGNRLESLVIASFGGGSVRNYVAGNVIDRGAMGILLHGCGTQGNDIQGNGITSTRMPALRISGGAWGNRVSSNTIRGMVVLQGSSFNRLDGNWIDAVQSNGPLAWLVDGADCQGKPQGSLFNQVVGNVLVGGLMSLLVSGDRNLGVESNYNFIQANHFIQAAQSGIRFSDSANWNDARNNAYQAVPTDVLDYGQGNLWP